jgi:glutamyl-tRNA reductase
MARLLVQHLMPRHPKSITVVNRGEARIEELQKQFPDANIIAAKLDNMLDVVSKSDVTFACTSAREPILHKDNLEGLLHRDAMLVDISVPRNIDDVGANQLKEVHAYNVDDLKVVVAANQARRRFIAMEAEDLLHHELHEFGSWHKSLGTVPMINRLQDRAEQIRSCEFSKMDRKLSGLTVSEQETVRRMSKNIVAKLLHGPLTHLRAMNEEESYENTVKSLESMFKLDEQVTSKSLTRDRYDR